MVTVIAGTNRKGSKTSLVAGHVASLLKDAGVEHTLLDLGTLPDVFQPQYYWNPPDAFAPFQEAVSRATKLLVVTPEYNGSFPGVLKYFIDLLKFPESFSEKEVAFIGVAAGQGGALRAIDHLQSIFHYLGAHVFGRRLMIPRVGESIDASGAPVDPKHRELLRAMLSRFTGAQGGASAVGGRRFAVPGKN